ncbi:hypothetical protein D3C81_1115430 [compost metagenome]
MFRQRGVAFGVIPDEQQLVLFHDRPAFDLGPWRDALGVGDVIAHAIGAPTPGVERAADRVAFNATGAQVGAHVRAVAIKNMQLAVFTLERHQTGAEHLQAMGLAVAVLRGQAQAMPATGVAVFQQFGFDAVQGTHLIILPRDHGVGACNGFCRPCKSGHRLNGRWLL